MKLPMKTLLALTGLSLLAGCANYAGIAPNLEVRHPPGVMPLTAAVSAAAPSPAPWPGAQWWRAFGDDRLAELIEKALADNPSLQGAEARLRRAQAMAGVAGSALWPQVGLTADGVRERFSEHGEFPPPYAGTTLNIREMQLGAQWELDFFGRHGNELKTAVGEARAADAERQAAAVLLAANVAHGYYGVARLAAREALARQQQVQRSEMAALVARRQKAGLDTRLDLELATSEVPQAERELAALEEQLALARHALAVLTGQSPEALASLKPAQQRHEAMALPPALPANLLGHRADVAGARWRVESALGAYEAGKASFYPNVDLRVFTGYMSVGRGDWIEAGNRQPGLSLAASLPIFDAGRLRNLQQGRAADVDSAVASYNGVVLGALRDVADQLSSLRSVERQLERQQAALAHAERVFALAEQRFQAGVADKLVVLNARNQLLNQQRLAVDLQARRTDQHIELIRALGGGFEDAAPPVAPTTSRAG